jgi:arsenate reductase
MAPPTRVLFACVHNAGRSQMAAAWLNAMADPGKATAISAGTQPAKSVHAEVLEVMREVGIDLSAAVPTFLSEELAGTAQLLVTMGCGDACPYVPGLEIIDWALSDPRGRSVADVRAIRDDIRGRVLRLLEERGWDV